MSKNRVSKNIKLPKRILILCEGESEIIYLTGLKLSFDKERAKGIDISIYQPENFSPLGLVREAKDKIKEAKKDKFPYHCVWIVFDKDGHANIPQAFHEARTYKPEINIAFSLICFEYWIILHFLRTTQYFRNCSEAVHFIESNNYIRDYSKTMNFYPHVKDKMSTAIVNCDWLLNQNQSEIERGRQLYDLQAYTNFNELVNNLIDLVK